ncbi:unnamed protein product [Lactuca virosa]|uniref:Uncharacterized protein n=1 Tax=Lactuca virosa TaxID=75947 RepID=A0AAU9N0P3_9ASTR|nr:unnamed protein product [Lactuca virosa]
MLLRRRTRRVFAKLGEYNRVGSKREDRDSTSWRPNSASQSGSCRSSCQTFPAQFFQQSTSRGEFPSSRNGSTATMPARLNSSSSGLRSDAGVVSRSSSVMLCSVSSGLHFDAEGKALVSSGLRSDAEGKALVSSGLRSDAEGKGPSQFRNSVRCIGKGPS